MHLSLVASAERWEMSSANRVEKRTGSRPLKTGLAGVQTGVLLARVVR